MAIEFYSSINLNQNELQHPRLQQSGSDPTSPTPVSGQLYYNSGDNTVRYHNGTSWLTLSTTTGDITGVTAGNGLTGGGSSGAVTLTVGAGTGITVNSGDVAVTAAQTGITSVVNSSLEIGRDADNRIKFGTDNQIIFEVSGGDNVIFKASGEIEASSLDISGNIDIDGTANLDAVDIDGVVNFAAVDHVMQNGANINDPSDNLMIGFATNAVTLGSPTTFDSTVTVESDIIHKDDANNKIAFGTDTQSFQTGGTARINISDSGLQIGSGARVTTIEDNDSLGTSDTKLATQGNVKAYVDGKTFDDVSVANLKTRLAGGFGSNAVTIGDSNDVVTIGNDLVITGDLTVSGDTITANVGTLNVEDKNIVLNQGSSDTSSTADGAGITIQDAVNSDTDATLLWNAANDKFVFSHLIEAPGTSIFTNLDISGDVDVDGTLEADAITVNGSTLASVIAGTTVTTATNANHVLITDNENTDEENQITFIEGAAGGTANRGLEADGDFTYNPSTGTVSATIFKGNIDAVDGDFDGTMEADAISIGGTTITATAAEINLIDGGTARGTTAVADGDGILTNDGGTMRMTKVETFATYFGAEIASNRMVVADIDVSSLTDDLRATITHNLGTADVMVQLYDKTTEATVYADIGRTTDDFSTASTSVITVDFGTAPPNDIRCVITSLADAASGSVAYT
jgi:hypothetical protein